jgi:hypothetical protein
MKCYFMHSIGQSNFRTIYTEQIFLKFNNFTEIPALCLENIKNSDTD